MGANQFSLVMLVILFRFILSASVEEDDDKEAEILRREFIVNQLLYMIPAFDLADEVGR